MPKGLYAKVLMFFLILCLGLIAVILVKGAKIFNRHKGEIIALKNKLSVYTDRDNELGCMEKSLQVAYDLSSWEAKHYAIMFWDFSKKFNVDWTIYPPIVWIESRFKTGLVSSKGAKGIMQIMEGTGKLIAEPLGIKYKENLTLWNEILNMTIGLEYLSEGIAEDTANIYHGVMRYLGGPNYAISGRSNEDVKKYLDEYRNQFHNEYTKFSYIYRGVCDCRDN